MDADTLSRLLGLIVVLAFAVGMTGLLLWQSARAKGTPNQQLVGYPPEHYPNQGLTRTPPLADLAATQARLVAVAQQLPAQSDLAVWVRAFLIELREIMDTAYRVAAILQVYGRPIQLERLVAEVQQIEVQVAAHIAQRLLLGEADTHSELLDGRLATLRMCARELALLAQVA